MNISNSSVDELQEIMQTQLTRKISKDDARRYGSWLLKFYGHLAKNGTQEAEDGNRQLTSGTNTEDIK